MRSHCKSDFAANTQSNISQSEHPFSLDVISEEQPAAEEYETLVIALDPIPRNNLLQNIHPPLTAQVLSTFLWTTQQHSVQ